MDLLSLAKRPRAAFLPASIATLLAGFARAEPVAGAEAAARDSLAVAADTLAAAAAEPAAAWAVWPWVLASLAGALLLYRTRR